MYSFSELLEKLPVLTYKMNEATKEFTVALNKYSIMKAMEKAVYAKVFLSQTGKTIDDRKYGARIDSSLIRWNHRWARAERRLNKAREAKDIAELNWQTARTLISAYKKEIESISGGHTT